MPGLTTTNVPTEVDVVIIGAGPTGLFTALLAEKLGLSVCIIDKAPGPLEFGRADALNARTQEYFELAGVLGDLEPHSIHCDTISTFSHGRITSRQNHWWRSLKHTHYKSFLIIGQPDIERATLAHLRNTVVHFDTEASNIIGNSDGVVTTFGSHSVNSKYVVGADGARSFVRAAMGIKFEGSEPGIKEAVLDAEVDTDFPVRDDIIAFERDGKARVSWIPRERGLARFYVLVDGEWTQESVIQDIRSHMAPHKINFKRIEWISSFEVKERVASSFISSQNNRVILAGDAAHTSSANGAQGMNTGIADAFALVWRLNLAIKWGCQDLLKTYSEERKGHATRYVNVAAKLVRSTLKTAEEYVSNIEKSADYITGMGVKYGPGPLGETSSLREFVAGHRCPDFELEAIQTSGNRPQASKNTFYRHLTYGKFVLLLFNCFSPALTTPTLNHLIEVWHVVDDAYKNTDNKLPVGDFLGKSEFIHQEGAVVVRPDLYIGYAGRVDGVEEYLERLARMCCAN